MCLTIVDPLPVVNSDVVVKNVTQLLLPFLTVLPSATDCLGHTLLEADFRTRFIARLLSTKR